MGLISGLPPEIVHESHIRKREEKELDSSANLPLDIAVHALLAFWAQREPGGRSPSIFASFSPQAGRLTSGKGGSMIP